VDRAWIAVLVAWAVCVGGAALLVRYWAARHPQPPPRGPGSTAAGTVGGVKLVAWAGKSAK
jgi:hypothetical protein